MIEAQALEKYLGDLLEVGKYKDYAPNGLQVQGKPSIARIATAVTASLDVIEQAIAWQADALLVHHGYFWKGEDPTIIGMKALRLTKLLSNQISLFAYHLPLDCHLTLGNNARLGALFKTESIQCHDAGDTTNLLWSGRLLSTLTPRECSDFLASLFQREPLHIAGGGNSVRSIAWCSGAAQDFIVEASQLGVDAFVSGEVSERTYYQAQELGIHYFACGHHATERFGIQALGEQVAKVFQLEHRFIDSKNPI